MEYVIPAVIGIGLSAACGFRIFVPPFVLSLASQLGFEIPPMGEDLAWVTSWPATVALGAAMIAEVGAYYIPFVDNLLDTIATPAAIGAGSLVTAGMLGDADPALKWGLAIIAGGGAAGLTQTASVAARAASTATTGGVGNPVISTGENVGSFLLAVLAIVLPLVALVVVVVVLGWAVYKLLTWSRKKPSPSP